MVLLVLSAAGQAGAQTPGTPAEPAGFHLPDSDRLRVSVDLLAGFGEDRANATLGFEWQGRIGYAILTASGRVHRRLSYKLSINPIEETSPRPACGAPDAFYPNDPRFLYGEATEIPCDPRYGNRRVDAYRGIALDVVPQQGAVREAFVEALVFPNTTVRFGRTRLPIGLDWQEAGSMTAKDALMIQRVNAQANFGLMATYSKPSALAGVPRFALTFAAHLGDTNRWFDYDYFYFEDGSFGTHSQFTYLLSGRALLWPRLEVRGSYQNGATGSKVERLPSYWASKRNDNAKIFSVIARPLARTRVIVEAAEYRWGPRPSSADMLGVDPAPIFKRGYNVTVDSSVPIRPSIAVGGSASYEKIDRADSLVRWLASQELYHVTTGRHDERTAIRAYVDLGPAVRVGVYRTLDYNPFPWISGITGVGGDEPPVRVGTNKWGVMARLTAR